MEWYRIVVQSDFKMVLRIFSVGVQIESIIFRLFYEISLRDLGWAAHSPITFYIIDQIVSPCAESSHNFKF